MELLEVHVQTGITATVTRILACWAPRGGNDIDPIDMFPREKRRPPKTMV